MNHKNILLAISLLFVAHKTVAMQQSYITARSAHRTKAMQQRNQHQVHATQTQPDFSKVTPRSKRRTQAMVDESTKTTSTTTTTATVKDLTMIPLSPFSQQRMLRVVFEKSRRDKSLLQAIMNNFMLGHLLDSNTINSFITYRQRNPQGSTINRITNQESTSETPAT